jgi:hypothetical protein
MDKTPQPVETNSLGVQRENAHPRERWQDQNNAKTISNECGLNRVHLSTQVSNSDNHSNEQGTR